MSAWPLRTTKPASGAPMLPRPMNPTRIAFLLVGARLLRQQSLGPPDHQHHEYHTDQHLLCRGEPHTREERDHVFRESAAFEQTQQHHGTEQRAAVVSAAAEDKCEPYEETFLRQEHVRLDVG